MTKDFARLLQGFYKAFMDLDGKGASAIPCAYTGRIKYQYGLCGTSETLYGEFPHLSMIYSFSTL